MNSNDPNCSKTGHSPRHRHWKRCTQKFYLPGPNISTNLYVYTYIHQSIQIRMQETQTGMAPFFKQMVVLHWQWPIERSHHPILRPLSLWPNIRVIQTDPKHSQTNKGPRIVCDQSICFDWWILVVSAYFTILIGDQYFFGECWWSIRVFTSERTYPLANVN